MGSFSKIAALFGVIGAGSWMIFSTMNRLDVQPSKASMVVQGNAPDDPTSPPAGDDAVPPVQTEPSPSLFEGLNPNRKKPPELPQLPQDDFANAKVLSDNRTRIGSNNGDKPIRLVADERTAPSGAKPFPAADAPNEDKKPLDPFGDDELFAPDPDPEPGQSDVVKHDASQQEEIDPFGEGDVESSAAKKSDDDPFTDVPRRDAPPPKQPIADPFGEFTPAPESQQKPSKEEAGAPVELPKLESPPDDPFAADPAPDAKAKADKVDPSRQLPVLDGAPAETPQRQNPFGEDPAPPAKSNSGQPKAAADFPKRNDPSADKPATDGFVAEVPLRAEKPASNPPESTPALRGLDSSPANQPASQDPFAESPAPIEKPDVTKPDPPKDELPGLDAPTARRQNDNDPFAAEQPSAPKPPVAETKPPAEFPPLEPVPEKQPASPVVKSKSAAPIAPSEFPEFDPPMPPNDLPAITPAPAAQSKTSELSGESSRQEPTQPESDAVPMPARRVGALPSLEDVLNQKQSTQPALDSDFPSLDKLPTISPSKQDASPTGDKPAAKKLDPAIAPLTLDELPPLEEKPTFPGFSGTSTPEPKETDSIKITPAFSSSEPSPSQQSSDARQPAGDFPLVEPVQKKSAAPQLPVEPPRKNEEPHPAPSGLKIVPNKPDTPTVGDLKGDGTIRKSTPRGKLLPQLQIEKQAPKQALLNKPFVYSILIRNVGTAAADDVTVRDQIPKGSNLTGTIPQAELVGRRLVWKIGRLEPGKQQKIDVRVVPVEPGPIGSIATVNFVAEVGAETLITDADVTLDVKAPAEAHVGEMVNFQFTVHNGSPQTLTGLVLRDVIPEGLHHVAGNDLETPLDPIPAGADAVESLELKVVKPGTHVNRVILTAAGGLQIESTAAVKAGGGKLSVTRSGPRQRFIGRPAIYQNAVTNTSNETVQDATIVEQIPEGMNFVSASAGGQYHEQTRSIFWKIPSIEPGRTVTVQAKLAPEREGELKSIVRVVEPQGTEIQTVSHTSVEKFAAVGVELTEFDNAFGVGDKVLLRIVATNRGNEAAQNVAVHAKIPPAMQLMLIRGRTRYRIEGREVVFEPMQSLDPGAEEIIELELEAARPTTAQVAVDIQSQRMPKPLSRQTAVRIVAPTRQ